MTKEKALEILQRQVRGVNTMRGIRRFGASFTKWKRDTETAIREIFGHEHGHLVAFGSISYGANGWTVGTKTPAKEAEEEGAWQEGQEHAESILRSFIDEINDYWGICISGLSRTTIRHMRQILRHKHDRTYYLKLEWQWDAILTGQSLWSWGVFDRSAT